MRFQFLFAMAVVCSLFSQPSFADEKSDLLQKEVDALVKDLDKDAFDVRQDATDKLIEKGNAVGEPVRVYLAKRKDPEVRFRLNAVLKKLKISNTASAEWDLMATADGETRQIKSGKRKLTFELGQTDMNCFIQYADADGGNKGTLYLEKKADSANMIVHPESGLNATLQILKVDPTEKSFTVGYGASVLFTMKLVKASKYEEEYEIFSKEMAELVNKKK